MAIEFFGEVDRDSKGKVSSEMPAWFHVEHLAKLEETVGRKERQLLRDEIPQETIHTVRNEIKKQKERIKLIKASAPKLVGGQKDKLSKSYHALRNQIADTMPTEMEVKKGFVRPQDELLRWDTKSIKVDPELAKACNVEVTKDGKVSGKGADKMFKLVGKRLGENCNVERLRKPGKREAYRDIEEFTKHILEKQLQGAK